MSYEECTDSSCTITPHYRAEVTTSDDGGARWYTNTLRFHERASAQSYSERLAAKWMLVTRWRAVEDTVPEKQRYEPGSEDGAW